MNHRCILIAGGMVVVLGLCGIVAHGVYAQWRDRRDALAETLTPVIGRAFAGGTRVVHLGDTRHARSDPLMRWLAYPEIMQRLHAQGVTMLCLESPALMQRFADGVAAGRLSRAQYADSLIACGYATTSGYARERFFDEAAIIEAAARAGLRVLLVDFENGKEESRTYYRALQKARINSGYEDFGPDGEWQARYPHLSPAQQREIDAFRAAFIKARHDDARLASALAKLCAPGEKILLVYGAAHGAGSHDLNELLAETGVPLVRFNIHADRKAFDDYSAIPTEPPQGSYILAEHLFIPAGECRPVARSAKKLKPVEQAVLSLG